MRTLVRQYGERWRGWSNRFAALQKREKRMVAGATLFAILFGGYIAAVDPVEAQKQRIKKAITQQLADQAQLTTQVRELAMRAGDPDAANRGALAELRRQLAVTEAALDAFDDLLASPAQAPALLQRLLANHPALTLISLKTLPPQPLVAPREGAAAASEGVSVTAGNLYRHGIEIRIGGRYHDLLAYVAELEGGRQRLLWGPLKLAGTYPANELTLTIFILSTESAWLAV